MAVLAWKYPGLSRERARVVIFAKDEQSAIDEADSVTKSDLAACYDAGWNGHTVHLVATLSGFFNQMSRWVNILGMKYDEEEVIGSSDYLTNTGYGPNDSKGLTDEEYKREFPDYLDTTFVMKDQSRVNVEGQ